MSRSSVSEYLFKAAPSRLVTAAAGILVAVPAVLIHNILRGRVEKMRRELRAISKAEDPTARPFRRAQTLPLGLRFSCLPSYAPVAAPVFATVVIVYMLFRPYIPVGLHVGILPMGRIDGKGAFPSPIVVSMVEKQNGEYIVRVNFKETAIDDLEQALAEKLKPATQSRIYVEAGRSLSWGSVANVIDKAKGLNCEVILLTTVPAKNANCAWPSTPTQDSHCR